jgi:DNA-binding response OmpR family regulator
VTRRSRILIVEDDDTLRDTLAEVMADAGYEVRAAAHGIEALDRLGGWEADLIVLDLMMPRMDAFEFRELQRGHAAAPSTRILVLSAAREVEAAAHRLEADAWLTKPFALVEVLDTVERLVGESGPGDGRATRPEASSE